MLINEAMAKKFFPGENPVGKRLHELGMDRHRDNPITVIGVVGDVRSSDLGRLPGPQHFVPYRQRPERGGFGVFVLRTGVSPASLGAVVRSQLRLIDINVLTDVETLTDIRARSVGDRRFTMLVLGGFALLGLLLSAIGIYGVLAYSVARRTREIGVRMALGAERHNVVRLIVGQGLVLTLIGASGGILIAFAVTRVLQRFLYGISSNDPLTFAGVALLLMSIALLACYIPARRATKVDPLTALRHE